MSDKLAHDTVPVSFGAKLAGSQSFAGLFREGMALVEETAAYLDGPGRKESKSLQRNAALAYATESMRLTTRLMQQPGGKLHQARGERGRDVAHSGESGKIQGQALPRGAARGGDGAPVAAETARSDWTFAEIIGA